MFCPHSYSRCSSEGFPYYSTCSYPNGELDIQITGPTNYDFLNVLGNIDFGTGSAIKFIFSGFDPLQGDTFNFLSAYSINGLNNANLLYDGLGAGFGFNLNESGGNLELATVQSPVGGGGSVPEPGTLPLFALGLCGLFSVGRHRRTASEPA